MIGFSWKDFNVFRYKVLILLMYLKKYDTKKYSYRKHLNLIYRLLIKVS